MNARPLNPLLGYVFGAVYVLVGLVGFAVSGGHGFAGHDGGRLLGVFMVNPLHNLVHIAVGAALLSAAYAGVRAARGVNTLVGAVYLLVAVVGLFVTGDNSANVLALNSPDNVLHFASAALLLGVGLTRDRTATAAA